MWTMFVGVAFDVSFFYGNTSCLSSRYFHAQKIQILVPGKRKEGSEF